MSELSDADWLRMHGNAIVARGYYALGARLGAIADRLETLERENARLRDALDLIASICAAPPYVPDKTIQKIADEALGNFDALQAEAGAALVKP